MSKGTLNIFVACGSGIATSTVIQQKVNTLFQNESDIKANVTRGNLNQIPAQDGKVDLILVTSAYKRPTTTPVIQVSNLLSGVKEDEKNKEILEASEEILNKKNEK